MALTKRNYVSGKTVITAENLNEIQDAIIALESAGDDGTHPVYYIDLAGSYPNYTCPVAMADIRAAYEAGKVLKCRCIVDNITHTAIGNFTSVWYRVGFFHWWCIVYD